MKQHVDERLLIAIIAKQIEGLKTFLNVKSNFTGEQVADTAELIVQDFDDLSLTAFQDCINKIKMAKPPFDKKLYESIDGRKLFEYLNRYREFQIEHLEKDHKFNKHKQPDFELDKMPVEIVNGLDDKIVEMQRRGAREVFENPIPKLVKKRQTSDEKVAEYFKKIKKEEHE